MQNRPVYTIHHGVSKSPWWCVSFILQRTGCSPFATRELVPKGSLTQFEKEILLFHFVLTVVTNYFFLADVYYLLDLVVVQTSQSLS
jgi:hypothetical protein